MCFTKYSSNNIRAETVIPASFFKASITQCNWVFNDFLSYPSYFGKDWKVFIASSASSCDCQDDHRLNHSKSYDWNKTVILCFGNNIRILYLFQAFFLIIVWILNIQICLSIKVVPFSSSLNLLFSNFTSLYKYISNQVWKNVFLNFWWGFLLKFECNINRFS